MMEEGFELRLEIPVIAPDTPETVGVYVRQAILEAEAEAGLTEQPPTFAQGLPTKEEIELIVAVLALAKVGIEVWPEIRKFLRSLATRLGKTLPVKVNAEVRIGDKTVKVEGLTPEDAVRVIIDEYEVHFRPRKRG
ncbi:MAG: hypothetical protein KAW49_03550 [Anaerolineae bacterium]|nr:hypothetical protein [Anaerolineae bacterium]